MKRIIIYRESKTSPSGRMYLCADGSTSSECNHAQEHWSIQFDSVIAENWIVQPAIAEIVGGGL